MKKTTVRLDDQIHTLLVRLNVFDFPNPFDEQRIFDPDMAVTLLSDTRVEFIKILPLVGG